MYQPNLILKIIVTGIALYAIVSCKSIPMTKELKKPTELTALWIKLDSLEKAGLPKSALEVAIEIEQISSENGLIDHQIKALLFENRFRGELEEDGIVGAIKRLTQEAEDSDGLKQLILFSYLGELYQNYLRDHRWQLQDRLPQTETPTDVQLMSARDLQSLSDGYYLRSLESEDLTEVPLDSFHLLLEINATISAEQVELSLFDLLLHRSLDHFMDRNLGLPESRNVFRLADPALFSSDFSGLNLEFEDPTDHRYIAMKLFQKGGVEGSTQNIPFTLKRLSYLLRESENTDKDTLYVSALKDLVNSSLRAEDEVMVRYALASYYYQQGDLVASYKLCSSELANPAEGGSAPRFQELKRQIEQKFLVTEVEQVALPSQALLGSIRYRNVQQVYSKLVKLTSGEWNSLNTLEQEERLRSLLGRQIVEAFSTELPDPQDYKEHGTEVVISPKEVGSYVWLLSNNADFSTMAGIVVVNMFQISELSFSEESLMGEKKIRVFDRNSGNVLSNISAQFFENNYSRGKLNRSLFATAISDDDGYISIPDGHQRGLSLVISRGHDTLALDGYNYWTYRNRAPNVERLDVRFFLDRSIYRPGQLVHYKAVLLSRDENQHPNLLTDRKVELVLRDANGQELESQMKISNLFGSVWGSFVLPPSGRLGAMSISVKESSQSIGFQVEEYKRPSFQIAFDTASGGSLNANFEVTGTVSSFAGAPIGNSNYEYHVLRKSRFSGFRGWWRSPWSTMPDKEIASGVATTDGQGNFRFPFFADAGKPDNLVDYRIYDFVISMQITDASGESQLSNTIVTLGSKNHGVEMVSDDIINISSTNMVRFIAKSPSGNPVLADASVVVHRIKEEPKWRRDRYWPFPDQPILDKGIFDTDLPWYPSAELDMDIQESASLGAVPASSADDGIDVDLTALDLDTGIYCFAVTTVLDNQIQESNFFVRFVNPALPFVPANELMHLISPEMAVEVGEEAILYVGSATTGRISYVIERKGQLMDRVELESTGGWQQIRIPIEEVDRGGVFVNLQCAFQNRTREKQVKIDVPWSDKQLDMHFETIRRTVKPGDREVVGVKITRDNAVFESGAEVLASMYDASLDVLFPHKWNTDFFPITSPTYFSNTPGYRINYGNSFMQHESFPTTRGKWIPSLRWFGLTSHGRRFFKSGQPVMSRAQSVNDSRVVESEMAMSMAEDSEVLEQRIEIRNEFGENLIYYPDLQLDENGTVKFEYEVNDALTTWKMMLFVHDKSLASGYREVEIVSRKELMITVNKPRFLRAGDEVVLSGKIDNLTSQKINGIAKLSLVNALDSSALDFASDFADIDFEAPVHGSTSIEWKVKVPKDFGMPIQFTMVAMGEKHSDGEQGVLPVLENRTLVTKTRVIEIGPGKEITFDLEELYGEGSHTALPHNLTMEITSNPVWHAITSLPYIMDAQYASSEQILNQFYANALGLRLVEDYPLIKQMVKQWGNEAPGSPLLINQHLKNSLIQESPWLLDAMKETDQMRRIAIYFDRNRMDHDLRSSLAKLKEMQNGDGGFAWFLGGRPNWYMSQYVLEGLIQMREWITEDLKSEVTEIIDAGLIFMEQELLRYHKEIVKRPITELTTGDHLTPIIVYYLYVKTLAGVESSNQRIRDLERFHLSGLKLQWNERSLFEQALSAQIFGRLKQESDFVAVTNSLRERVLSNPGLGSHWKYEHESRWWKLPIETHARLIALFSDIPGDEPLVKDLKRWLLNHKRTNSWSNSKATAEAIQALTMGESSWIKSGRKVMARSDGKSIDFSDARSWGNMQETLVLSEDKMKDFGPIEIVNPNDYPTWGAMYFQFFEDLDKIREDRSGPLEIKRNLFVSSNSDRGRVLKAISSTGLELGDRIVVELEIRTDRDMEFVHIKDLRGAAFEPLSVLSTHVWKGGLGYFQSTTDLATNFFIDYLPRGTYTIQYEMLVSQNGDFSGGNSMIQSMYAPEFAGHSHGSRIEITR